jgi:outer membrane receptor protein involved in Fe transport
VLDGVPQSDPFGGWINWPAYDSAALSSVRVVRGGGSVTHGPGALSGLIEMSSLAETTAEASIEGGSRRSIAGNAVVGRPIGSGLATLSIQGSRGDGFTPVTQDSRGPVDRPAPFAQGSARARWLTLLGQGVELQLSALGFVDRRDRGVPFTVNRTRGADASVRLVGKGEWQWSANAYFQTRNLRSSFASVSEPRESAARVSLQDSVPSDAIGGAIEVRPPIGGGLELRIGADGRLTDGKSKELYAYAGGEPSRRRISGGQSRTTGIFIDGSWSRAAVSLSGGARLDRWGIDDGELVERLLSTGVATRDEHYAARTGWRPTARAGAVLAIDDSLSLRSAAYLGWRLPTLNELFRPFRAGPDATAANPLLEPERLQGIEAGLDWRRDSSRISFTTFANRLDDAVANVTLGHGPGSFPGVGFVAGDYRQRLNVESIRTRGIEFSASTSTGPWSLRLDSSLVWPRVRASGVAAPLNGLRPAQTPRLSASASVDWQRDGRMASLIVTHLGSQYDDDLNQRRLPAATVVGAFGALPLRGGWNLTGRAENLFDTEVVAGRAEDDTTERGTPRTVWIGLRYAPRR